MNQSLALQFEHIVSQHPLATAIVTEQESISYQKLDNIINTIATVIQDDPHIAPFSYCAVMMERDILAIATILAISKAGCIPVFIDTAQPQSRLIKLLKAVNVNVLISHRDTSIDNFYTLVINNNIDGQSCIKRPAHKSTNIAYVIFTSGTEGQAKAIEISELALHNVIKWQIDRYHANSSDNVLQYSPLGFDVSVSEIYLALLSGATLYIYPEYHKLAPEKIHNYLERNKITICKFSSHIVNLLPRKKIDGLKYLITGGDVLSTGAMQFWSKHCSLVNEYGLSETAIIASSHLFRENDPTNIIGQPLPGYSFIILDENLSPVKEGKAGELHIHFSGMSHQYLTHQGSNKFIQYTTGEREKPKVLFSTGDIVRALSNNCYQFINRKSNYYKINGYRISPSEIEEAIRNHPMIKQAVVTPYKDSQDNTSISAFLNIDKTYAIEKLDDKLSTKNWLDIYQNFYLDKNEKKSSNLHAHDGLFDFIQGKELSGDETKDWYESTLKKIKELSFSSVLEIGCGEGNLALGLLEKADKYVAIEPSEAAILSFKKKLYGKGSAISSKVTIQKGYAHDIRALLKNQHFDLVIMNSVIQYFPSLQYLTEVMQELGNHTTENSYIFIGDIKNYKLKTMYYYHKERISSGHSAASIDEVDLLSESNDIELMISPDYFYFIDSPIHTPYNSCISLKTSQYVNDFSVYRYDVILSRANNENLINLKTWLTPPEVDNMLETHRLSELPIIFGVSNVINNKVVDIAAALDFPLALGETMHHIKKKAIDRLAQLDFRHYEIILPNSLPHEKAYVFYKSELQKPYKIGASKSTSYSKNISTAPLIVYNKQKLITLLKESLEHLLPSYLWPHHYIILNKLPTLYNDKINYSLLQKLALSSFSFIKGADKYSSYNICYKVWSSLFPPSRISNAANFFHIGGDSITAIRISSLFIESGHNISVHQILRNPIFLSQVKLVEEARKLRPLHVKKEKVGEWPLSPIQRWFFNSSLLNSEHFSQGFVFKLDANINMETFIKALSYCIQENDMFHMKYTREFKGDYKQYYTGEKASATISFHKLSDNVSNHPIEYEEIMQSIYNRISLEDNLLFLCGIINGAPDNQPRVYLLCHHLIIDGVSWRILTSQITYYYKALVNHEENPSLLKPEINYKDWVEAIHRYTSTPCFHQAFKYWKDFCLKIANNGCPFSVEETVIPSVTDFVDVNLNLTVDETLLLKTLCSKSTYTNIEAVLCSALVLSFKQALGLDKLLICLEGHGRNIPMETINASQIIGWFTTYYPAELTIDKKLNLKKDSISSLICSIEQQLQSIPNKGFDYIIIEQMRNLITDKSTIMFPTPRILLNYLGQFDNEFYQPPVFCGIDKFTSRPGKYSAFQGFLDIADQNEKIPFFCQITSWICEQKLHFVFSFSKKHFSSELIAYIPETFSKTIGQYIASESSVPAVEKDIF